MEEVEANRFGNHEEEHMLKCLEMFNQYERMIDSLSKTVEFYQEELQSLKAELFNFVEENKNLSNKLEETHKHNLELQKVVEQNKLENKIIENLRDQLELTLKENQNISELWQSSLKTIDCLEKELNILRGDGQDFVSQSYLKREKEKYENELKTLQEALEKLQNNLKETITMHTKTLKEKNEEILQVSKENKNVKIQTESLGKELKELRERQFRLDLIQEQFNQLLKEKQNEIDKLKRNESETKLKMNETLIIIEHAVAERDAALIREIKSKEELQNLTSLFEKTRKEMETNMTNQLKNLESAYNEKIIKINDELKSLKEKLSLKNLEVEKYKKECEILNEEFHRIRRGNEYIDDTNTSRLLILEKNLENTFQKLLISEKKYLQLSAERDSIKCDMEQMVNMYQNDMKNREIEKNSLQNRIINLQNELDLNRKNILLITEKFEKLGNEIEKLTLENKKSLLARDQRNQKTLDEMKKMQENFEKIQKVTKKHLHLQNEINIKWQNGIEETTRKFEKRIYELKDEIRELKNKNLSLENAFKIANNAMIEYKKFYDQMCGMAKNISELAESYPESS